MNQGNSLAHPYANAIFEIAKHDDTIDKWWQYLSIISEVSKLDEFKLAVSNPLVSADVILNLLLDAVGSTADYLKRFLNLLIDNNRLSLLEAIFLDYQKIIANYKNNQEVVIETAFSISDKDKKDLEDILSKKFEKNISAVIRLNPDLIGGIKIILDDVVIDSSIKGNINKMFLQIMK
jgi:F-type H+-transporting ATPase subunit delta